MLLRPALVVLTTVALVVTLQPAPASPASPPAADRTAAWTLASDAVPLPSGSVVAPLAVGTNVRLTLTLASSDPRGLSAFLAAVADPASPEYRHFLSYDEFARRYGPSAAELPTVASSLNAAGASAVSLSPGGLGLEASLSVGAVERLLGIQLVRFAGPGAVGYSYTSIGTPRPPSSWTDTVTAIDGLSGGVAPKLASATLGEIAPAQLLRPHVSDYVQGNEGDDWFLGSDYTQAYEATELLPGNRSVPDATYPAGVAIATLLASGYNSTAATALPPWDPSVVGAYFNDTFPAAWPQPTVVGVPVDETGAPAPPAPGSFHGVNDSTGFETENSLDLEMAGSLAPGSSLYNFYFSGALTQNPATWSNVPGYLADDLGAALSFDYGPRHLAVVSCSFGLNDLNNSLWDTELAAAAATGVTVVVASGDQGDAPNPLTGRGDNPWPLWPASAAFNTSGAISVGGVTLALSGQPTSTYTHPPLTVQYDPNVEGIANVSAWWDTSAGAGNYAGTEGGTSIEYPEPWWQFHSAADPAIVRATQIEGTGHLGRAGPDVAFPGNSTIAFVSAASNGSIYFTILEGTSIACPVFAGILADVVAVENASSGHVGGLGFLDPELYRIGSYYAANPGGSDPFLDVVYGSNAMFSAGPGWDATTGWGGLCAPLFLAALENSTVTNYTYAGPTPTLPPSSGPRTPPLTIVIVFAAVAGAVLAVTVLFVTRSRRRLPPLAPPYAPGAGVYPPGLVGPPTGIVATFSCPYCGRERPAEPGHCPSCGAM